MNLKLSSAFADFGSQNALRTCPLLSTNGHGAIAFNDSFRGIHKGGFKWRFELCG